MKIVINRCFGGFGLSDEAYEQLIKWGVPRRAYTMETRGADGLYGKEPANGGEVVFDRDLSPGDSREFGSTTKSQYIKLMGRYWDTWLTEKRDHPWLIRVVELLGERANGPHAELVVVEIPNGVEWEIGEYDGVETIHEAHRSWN